MEQELVSIVLTLYNKAPYIEETIFSIYKQTYTNRELIIVDDCSTDWSFEIAKSFCEKLWIAKKCRFIQNEKNLRVAKTFERWLKEAKWEWISMCDWDDILMKNKLEKQIELCQKEQLDFCFSWYIEIDENNNYKWMNKYTHFMKRYFKNPSYKTYLITNDAIGSWLFFNRKIGEWLLNFGFPDNVYQDYWAIVWNYLLRWKVSVMNEKLFYYRRCNQCITIINSKEASPLQIYEKMLKMRFDVQNYALKTIKNDDFINWIKKLNNIDALLINLARWKYSILHTMQKILNITLEIFLSKLWLKHQLFLLWEIVEIIYLKFFYGAIFKIKNKSKKIFSKIIIIK